MISTSRHPACLMDSAVMLTESMSESVVGPNGSGLTSIRSRDREFARATLVRTPRLSGGGVLFILFPQPFGARHFRRDCEFFLHAILPRLVREQDHAMHETLELAE